MLEEIGDYQVVRKLGQGGMGAVFEGVHKHEARRVAIKMLLPHLSKQPDVVRRFFNEARAASLIGHPSVVETFETGTLPDGAAYLVMEFLDGQTLSSLLKERKRLGDAALPIVRDIAATLAQAHEKKIVHRDLKPDNVMLLPSPPSGWRVKVLDFGIAKIAQDAELAPGMGVRTKTGVVLGTPIYMSPEQCLGSKAVGAPTDVYALGAMLHQLIAGQPPFVGSGVGEVLAMQIRDAPPPLSTKVPGVAPELEKLTLEMLDKKPERRPTMAEALRRIEALMAGGDAAATSTAAATIVTTPSSIAPTMMSAGASLEPARHSRAWVGVMVAGVGAAALALFFATRATKTASGTAPTPTPTKTPTAAAATTAGGDKGRAGVVLWLIKSDPPRADVVRVSDGAHLGTTPWYTEEPAGQGNVEVIVRKSGFADEHATLSRARNTTWHVKLQRRPAATVRHGKGAKPEEDELEVKPLR